MERRTLFQVLSGADVAGVEAAGQADIGGSFDDGAAVGEDGQLIGPAEEAQAELVGAHLAQGKQAKPQILQVERAGALMDLDGVAAAQADRRPALAVEVGELALSASRTFRVARRLLDPA